MNYKVGDTVKINSEAVITGVGNFKNGEPQYQTSIGGNFKKEHLTLIKPAICDHEYKCTKCGEPLTKPEPPKHEYKVGQKVKIVDNTCCHGFPIGTVVEILYPTSSEGWEARSDNEDMWAVRNKDIEPYTEPKQEPVKLYAVDNDPYWVTKGKTYIFDGTITFDNGMCDSRYSTFEAFKKDNEGFAKILVPLVSRPAKVGEWVYVTDDASGTAEHYAGKIVKTIDSSANGFAHFNPDIEPDYDAPIDVGEYLVLDGYTEEEKPKYYNGKVVCVEYAFSDSFDVGKVYEYKDGYIITNAGLQYNRGDPAKTKDEALNRGCVKFVEYLGEA